VLHSDGYTPAWQRVRDEVLSVRAPVRVRADRPEALAGDEPSSLPRSTEMLHLR
jgi:hypothetical protein